MKEKELTEQESLAIITQMISNAQANLKARIDGNMFLLWGYVAISAAIIIWILKTFFFIWQASFLWLLVPAICYPIVSYKEQKRPILAKSYIDRIINSITIIFSAVYIIVALPSIWVNYEVLFFESVLISLLVMIIGSIIRNKIILSGGIAGMFVSMCFFIVPGENNQLLLFAALLSIAFIIPGHLFKRAT